MFLFFLVEHKGCELSLSLQPPTYPLLIFSHTYLDAVAWSWLEGLLVTYLRAFCSLWMQSAAKGWCFRDCRNLWTWGRRMLLGGKRPVHNHNSSQPFSSLYLHEEKPRRKEVEICFAQHAECIWAKRGEQLLLDVVVRELLEGLAVDFILQGFSFQGTFKYLVCQLINRAGPFGWVVTHVLQHW